MKLVLISDTHNHTLSLPEGDVLIHAGDLTMSGSLHELSKQAAWLKEERKKYRSVLVIAGNHDFCFETNKHLDAVKLLNDAGVVYLQDDWCVIEDIKFYGTPWQPWFYDWAFNLPRGGEKIKEKWAAIPHDTDVLITHGPPYGHGDKTPPQYGSQHVGCEELGKRVFAIKPLINVFGHIHNGYGVESKEGINFVNASICNESYKPVNHPIVMEV